VTKVADCVERMIQFRQRCPGAEFDLKPNLFTARVPGRDEPFRSMNLCKLMDGQFGVPSDADVTYLEFKGPVTISITVRDDGAQVSVTSHPGPAAG
jgi:hypothetical protein